MATQSKQPSLTVAQARLRRLEIERQISALIAEFEQQSGGIVDRIEIYRTRQIGVMSPYVVIKADIEL